MINFSNQESITIQAISAAIQATSAFILLLVTIYYAVQTRKTVKEMQETRRYEFLPILQIEVIAEDYNTLKLSIDNIGKGIARSPEIHIPLLTTPIKMQNLGLRNLKEIRVTVKPDEILSLKTSDKKIKIIYMDVFSRTVISEAPLMAESVEENNPRKNHLMIGNWSLILPK